MDLALSREAWTPGTNQPAAEPLVLQRRISVLGPKHRVRRNSGLPSLSIKFDYDNGSSTDTDVFKAYQDKKGRRRSSVSQFAEKFQNFSPKSLLDFVKDNIQGRESVFNGPFGRNRVIYCDYTASGKPLEFIEGFIQEFVHPFYGNTHTTSNVSSLQTSQFRKDAREIIKSCVNASSDDVVIFCGSGTTAAIHKLIHVMNMTPEKIANTVIIVGPYEHHSNILPWKEIGAKLVRIKDTEHGLVDLEDLEAKLKHHHARGTSIIGAFSATSNVTGIITDTVEVAELIHKYGGFSLWDYATGAPYLKIDMNPTELGYKDAVFCSPHKFVGGVGTPGILIAKKGLFVNPIPGGCGGGTVVYVTHETHTYVDDIEEREEGGTPAIVESIRAGMVFQLKQAIGADLIGRREADLCEQAFSKWRRNPNIYILGSHTAKRLPIFALIFKNAESGKLLHHNFVATLLNDLYGIQGRGGCACAGPYTQDILGIAEDMAQRFSWFLTPAKNDEKDTPERNQRILKPGFVRLNLPYFLDQESVDYVLNAVDIIATEGWKLLPLYSFDAKTGDFKHRTARQNVRSLQDITYNGNGILIRGTPALSRKGIISLEEVATNATETLSSALELGKELEHLEKQDIPLGEEHRHMIWFLLPYQAMMYLKNPVLKLLTTNNLPNGFNPQRNTLKRVKRRFRSLIVHALGEAEAGQLEFLRRTSVFDIMEGARNNSESEDIFPPNDDPPPYSEKDQLTPQYLSPRGSYTGSPVHSPGIFPSATYINRGLDLEGGDHHLEEQQTTQVDNHTVPFDLTPIKINETRKRKCCIIM